MLQWVLFHQGIILGHLLHNGRESTHYRSVVKCLWMEPVGGTILNHQLYTRPSHCLNLDASLHLQPCNTLFHPHLADVWLLTRGTNGYSNYNYDVVLCATPPLLPTSQHSLANEPTFHRQTFPKIRDSRQNGERIPGAKSMT